MAFTIAAVAAPMAALSGTAGATGTPAASTTPPYVGIAAYFQKSGIYSNFDASLGVNEGTVQVTNYNANGTEIDSYVVTVSCTSYPSSGVVYYGGLVTSGSDAGQYLMDELVAGGPGTGEVGKGYFSKALTCYNGTNGKDVGTLVPLLSPTIAVSQASSTASTNPVGPGIAAYFEKSGIYSNFDASLGANEGTVQVTNYNANGTEIDSYVVTVSCTSYPSSGVVYYGGLVTSGSDAGQYLMDELVAGGPGTGEVGKGYFSKALTCYNGTNGSEVGTLAPLSSPAIDVSN